MSALIFKLRPVSSVQRRLWRSCFTLIELLVVVSIIAILAAMLLPALTRARAVAQETACKANLKQVAMANILYEDDYMHVPPGYTSYGTAEWNGLECAWDLIPWQQFLLSYAAREVFACPSAKPVSSFPDTVGIFWWQNYGDNEQLNGGDSDPSAVPWASERQVEDPVATMQAMDGGNYNLNDEEDLNWGIYYIPGTTSSIYDMSKAGSTAARADDSRLGRHPSLNVSIAYWDGHVGREPGQDVIDRTATDIFWTGEN